MCIRDRSGFDLAVVDEAQDLINDDDLRLLDRMLANGLSDGRWAVLLDSNNQSGLVGRYEDAAMAGLREHRPAEITLTDNCRNTAEIVAATRERTGADLGVTTAGHGHEVTVLQESGDRMGTLLGDLLSKFEADEVSLDQVMLLSPSEFGSSSFAGLPTEWRHRVELLDLQRLRRPSAGRVGFAEVASFKGLESPFIVLELPSGLDAPTALSTLYVGMTRARAGLWVVEPTDAPAGADAR